ncbi:MAG: DUF4340 domain-containing protein [Gemmatimonadota bacterium]|nr:DUF4340 domain-containing protein [Gemmatimonadota bacterium]
MTAVRVHLGLLLVAVILAAQTWLRDSTPTAEPGRILAWEEDTTRVSAVVYSAADRRVEVQRRVDETGAPFYWGIEELAGVGTLVEYPVGSAGRSLVSGLARLSVFRDLGDVSGPPASGIGDESPRLDLVLGDRTRTLLLGDSTFGGEGRYAVEDGAGRLLVLPAALVRPLEIGVEALRERQVHRFLDGDVTRVRMALGDRTIDAVQGEGGWREEGAGGPDAALDGLMQRVGQLAIGGFDVSSEARTGTLLLRVDYYGPDDDAIGFVELFRGPGTDGAAFYLRSETTRVLARAVASLAERVEQGVEELLQP